MGDKEVESGKIRTTRINVMLVKSIVVGGESDIDIANIVIRNSGGNAVSVAGKNNTERAYRNNEKCKVCSHK